MKMRGKRTEPTKSKEVLELPFVLQKLPPSWRMRYDEGFERRDPLSSLSNSNAPTEGEIRTVTAPILKIIPQKIREMPSLEGSEEE